MTVCPDYYEKPPSWYPPTSVSIGFMTIPFAIYTFHLIHSSTPAYVDKRYKNCLLVFHTAVCFGSIINALAAHVQYMPTLLFVTTGILSFDPQLDSYFDILLQIYVCTSAGLPVLHRFLVVIGKTDKKIYGTVLILFFIACAGPFTIATIYFSCIYDKEKAVQGLKDTCPSHFVLTEQYEIAFVYDESTLEWTMNLLTATICFLTILAATVLSLSYYLLKKKKSNLSEATKRLQLKLLNHMIIQLGMPTIVHGIPSTIASAIVFCELKAPLYVSLSIWLVTSFHGIFNCLVFIFLNSFYLQKVKRDIGHLPLFSKMLCHREELRMNKVDTNTVATPK